MSKNKFLNVGVDLTFVNALVQELQSSINDLEHLAESFGNESFHSLSDEVKTDFVIKANKIIGVISGLADEGEVVVKSLQGTILHGPLMQQKAAMQSVLKSLNEGSSKKNAAAFEGLDNFFPNSKKNRDDLN